jgi:hypothetical protein
MHKYKLKNLLPSRNDAAKNFSFLLALKILFILATIQKRREKNGKLKECLN